MARVFFALAVLVAAVCAAPSKTDDARVLGLGLPFPFALPPFPGLGLIPPQARLGKPGLCPFVTRLVPPGIGNPASICGNLCTEDSYCPLGQKCCPHECGYSCFNAVEIVH